MKHSHFFEQDYSYATALSLADLGAQFCEKRINVAPLDVPTRGSSEDQFESTLMLSLSSKIVPSSGT